MKFATLVVPGNQALATLEARRSSFPQTGEYPFLIGGPAAVGRLQDPALRPRAFADILVASQSVQLPEWFRQRQVDPADWDMSVEELLGTWPDATRTHSSLTLHLDTTGRQVLPQVHLGLARIEHAWQLPAWLDFGGWNECPSAEIHCALHREWQSRYGAEIVGVSSDILECQVRNPPGDRDSAIELVWQMFAYCPDLLQGGGSLSELAAGLMQARHWFFWWD